MKTKLTFLTRFILLQTTLLTLQLPGEEGKIFLKTEPTGAEIIINEKTLGKTNTLLELPTGTQKITLRLPNHEDKTITINIHNKHIIKPDTIKMTPTTCKIDLLIEEGWQIYINDIQTTDLEGKPAETPCSINAPNNSKITLAKEGYVDIEFLATPAVTITNINGTKGKSKQLEKEKAETNLKKEPETNLKKEPETNHQNEFLEKYMKTLTEEQWIKIKGIEYKVPAKGILDTKIILDGTQKIAIIPHPTDKWSWDSNHNNCNCNWKGNKQDLGWLGIKIGDSNPTKCLTTKEKGKLYLQMYDTDDQNNTGSIRVKIIIFPKS